jgi:hypothetical protein
VLLLVLPGLAVGACQAAQPMVLQGNADTVQIGYAGDIDAATALAKRHCAQFERLPRLDYAEPTVAYFDCVRR